MITFFFAGISFGGMLHISGHIQSDGIFYADFTDREKKCDFDLFWELYNNIGVNNS